MKNIERWYLKKWIKEKWLCEKKSKNFFPRNNKKNKMKNRPWPEIMMDNICLLQGQRSVLTIKPSL